MAIGSLGGIVFQVSDSAVLTFKGMTREVSSRWVERMVESGDAEYLIIKGRPVGRHPFRLTASSETWGDMYGHGELAKANLTITLEEYT